ncbi:hypothetical protein, variant 2 [Aphanomyces invadans]|uniref:PH domain-containing protein n=1 Tax=Aphanomyces invadans TaxID=157072 RepID=A0A024UJ75_9STRA|nr:hypothetical protein, variant 2 [Aphanomyces invadans]ETW06250.1 hypothetical protein, variant 2 [Aphanomyces invadans]|eukprot:XP_008864325.1 hypothetical protein, variant 2 [Aphanomyces invadans]
MVEVVVLEGYLHKQSKHLKLWKIRYFVLAERALSYSKKSGKMAKNTYSLKDLDVIPDQNYVVHDHNFVFDVKYGDGEHMYLSAPTEAERLKWTQAIKATQGKLLHTDDGDGEKQLTDGRSSAASSTGVLGGVFQPPAATSRFQTTTSRYKRVATKERKDERKRARMPKMKKPFGAIWLDDVLPHWGDQAALVPPHLVEALCFAGIPKEIRGRAWSAMLGNRLQINEQLFDICRARAKAVLLEMDLVKEADEKSRQLVRLEHKLAPHQHVLEPQPQLHNERDHAHDDDAPPLLQLPAHLSIAGPPSRDSSTALDAQALADKLIADNERNIKLVQRDMPRTFGNHPLFQDGAAGAQKTYEVLEAYTCYRPDLGHELPGRDPVPAPGQLWSVPSHGVADEHAASVRHVSARRRAHAAVPVRVRLGAPTRTACAARALSRDRDRPTHVHGRLGVYTLHTVCAARSCPAHLGLLHVPRHALLLSSMHGYASYIGTRPK